MVTRYVSYRSGRASTIAATGISRRPVQFATRAEVQRDSLQADAEILHDRGVTHGEIARRLGVTRRTIIRWLG